MSKYIVVEFQTNEVAVVSEKWLTTDADERKNVLWPPYKSTSKINMAVRQHLEPEDSWLSCGIRRVMYSAGKFIE
ncbi:hypothetical protein DPMN_175228 [Dreissena polymorpha]|uniref:Uncharacterized protein n=1 Tax=Dreissena polymorpha TaxID=45954 RepID=A0A9D4IIJ3_DREPO|nr:hypothetical protein DPMN_175228 [Dreissena polymorpha]